MEITNNLVNNVRIVLIPDVEIRKTHTCRHNTPLPWQKKKKIKKIKSKIYDKEKDNNL